MPKQHSYKDWYSGKIYLAYCSTGELPKDNKPMKVVWDDIRALDISKIKKKQKELFEDSVGSLLCKWQCFFLSSYLLSNNPRSVIDNTIAQFERLLYDEDISEDPIGNYITEFSQTLCEFTDVLNIRSYIRDYKTNPVMFEYDFMHSPHFEYKHGMVPGFYAEAALGFIKWLREFREKEYRGYSRTKGKAVQEPVNKFCSSMPLITAVSHFSVMTQTVSRNGKKFLTMEQFILFIQMAFLGTVRAKKQIINFDSREKLFVVKRFYEFYSSYVHVYKEPRKKYIELLTLNFSGWDVKDVEQNFAKKVGRNWEKIL